MIKVIFEKSKEGQKCYLVKDEVPESMLAILYKSSSKYYTYIPIKITDDSIIIDALTSTSLETFIEDLIKVIEPKI